MVNFIWFLREKKKIYSSGRAVNVSPSEVIEAAAESPKTLFEKKKFIINYYYFF